MAVDNRVIYIGNLRNDIGKKELKENIFDLIKKYIGIEIAVGDITVNRHKEHGHCYAFVNCHDQHHAQQVLNHLSSWEHQRGFNFALICEGSKPLKSGLKQDPGHKKKKSKKKKHYDGSFEVSDKFNDFYTNKHDQDNMENGACKMQVSNPVPMQNGNPFSSFDQTPQGNTVHSGKYFEGDRIGTESRNREFKKGGGEYLKQKLKEHVSKYMCAFLNTEEEGTLYLGVTDEGLVEGVECPQSKEDDARLEIDEAVKSIQPAVFTNMYSVKFTPVFYPIGGSKEDYKVIEIHVRPSNDLKVLYEDPVGVFLRRDGGVQGPLKTKYIQEWFRQKLQKEINEYQKERKEHEKEIKEHQKEIKEHQKEIKLLEEQLKKQEYLLASSLKKKSKVCIII